MAGNNVYIGWQGTMSIWDGREQCLYRMTGNNVYIGWQGTKSI